MKDGYECMMQRDNEGDMVFRGIKGGIKGGLRVTHLIRQWLEKTSGPIAVG